MCFICVAHLTLFSSQSRRGPGCLLAAFADDGLRAAGTNSSSGGREIRFRRAAPPGQLEAASDRWFKRLPPTQPSKALLQNPELLLYSQPVVSSERVWRNTRRSSAKTEMN